MISPREEISITLPTIAICAWRRCVNSKERALTQSLSARPDNLSVNLNGARNDDGTAQRHPQRSTRGELRAVSPRRNAAPHPRHAANRATTRHTYDAGLATCPRTTTSHRRHRRWARTTGRALRSPHGAGDVESKNPSCRSKLVAVLATGFGVDVTHVTTAAPS